MAFLYSLILVLIKKLTDHYFLSPYLCLLCVGIFSSFLTFIGYSIYSFIKKGNLSIITDSFSEIDNEFLMKILGIFLFDTLYSTLCVLTVFYFSATLLMITDIITPMLSWLFFELKEEKSFDFILNCIGYFIALFGSLIYNEIIILNFCGFDKNTKKVLEERQKEELFLLKEIENKEKSGNYNDGSDSSDDSDNDINNDIGKNENNKIN